MERQMVQAVVSAVQDRLKAAGLALEAGFLGLELGSVRERLEQVKDRVSSELQRIDALDDLLVFRFSVEFPLGGTNELARGMTAQRADISKTRPHLRVVEAALTSFIPMLEGGSEAGLQEMLMELLVDDAAG